MKLSDAILLGSTLVQSGHYCTGSQVAKVGCALDMAVVAVGGKNWLEVHKYWPWLGRGGNPSDRQFDIAARFDAEVLLEKTLTLEQLCDWVRSVEPAEEAPRCAELAETCTDAVSKGVA